ncbi:MAG: universal stress protein [Sporomusaceae bacterium]|nr:universal stress protein [Sporomusaceae bacterium]
MFHKILVPVDGSDTALLAVKYARKLAGKFSSAVTLLHVIPNVAVVPGAVPMPDTVLAKLDETGNTVLAQAAAYFADYDGRVYQRLEYGPPGRVITEIALDHHFSLIIMGRRGLSNVTAFFLGSVSNHVVQHAPCPTMIIKDQEKTAE